MTAKKPIKLYRIYFGVISVFIFFLVIGFFSNVLAYFGTGADRSTALNIPPNLPEAHVPKVNWLPDDAETGRKMDEYTRNEIMRDYIRGWYQQHLSYASNTAIGLKEYFTPAALPKVKRGVQKLKNDDFTLLQTDLDHNINLHFYSADGQIVSFTDRQMVLKQRLYNNKKGEKIFAAESTNDYNVVMLLDDGYWRIKNIVRKTTSLIKNDTLAAKKDSMVQVKGSEFMLLNKPYLAKGINYYPQKTPWTFFWTNYDGKIINKDFAITKSLGFNTVRIFINFQDFNKGHVPDERLNQLQNLLDTAQLHGLKVIITLFDFVGDYSLLNFTASDRQLESLLTKFRNHKAIFAWDLKNEPDLDYNHHDKGDVKEWLTYTLKKAKTYDPNHLFTIGWAFPEDVDFLSNELDFISFHSYRSIEKLSTEIDLMQKNIKNKPLMLEEFGQSTYKGIWAPFGKNEKEQAEYFAKVKSILKQKGNISYLAWTLYDFSEVPSAVVGKMPWHKVPQTGFGLIKVDGKIKPGAKVLGGE